MSTFDRNELSLIQKTIDQEVAHPKIGKVTQVYEHVASNDDSNFEVDVEIDGGTATEQYCPVLSPVSGGINPPKAGDKVVLLYTEEATKKPFAVDIAWTNKDRPPVGKAGMWKREFESGSSPAGDGNLYVTGYTEYDQNVASNEKYGATPERSVVQIAKHAEDANVNPASAKDLPAKVEFHDAPADGQSWISVEINKRGGSDSNKTWGMKFNINTGEVKIADPNGYGIKSDGDGNFKWSYSSKNEVKESSGSISL